MPSQAGDLLPRHDDLEDLPVDLPVAQLDGPGRIPAQVGDVKARAEVVEHQARFPVVLTDRPRLPQGLEQPPVGVRRQRGTRVFDLEHRRRGLEAQPHRHSVATSERSGDVVEPLLSLQWFLRMGPLAKPALDAYRDGRVRFFPERHGRTYERWLENIRDWNVSRQIWWGHQLPVWYAPDGREVVAESEEEAREIALRTYGTSELTRDPDTLDTWFSSGIWPLSILGWPEETPELRCWYPSPALLTGGEIIFLWVARMVMLGLYFRKHVPFRDVVITPLVFDAAGRKMSKSLGNTIDPMELADKYGADAFRLSILRQMRLESQESRYQESRCEESRNFNNKIWNATRYLLALALVVAGIAMIGFDTAQLGTLGITMFLAGLIVFLALM